MTVDLTMDLREVLDGTPIAHVATVLRTRPALRPGLDRDPPAARGDPDGSGSQKARNWRRDPRVAIPLTPPENPFQPIILRGQVVDWLDGERGWAVIDQIARKYLGTPYPRGQERVVALIEIDHQKMGM